MILVDTDILSALGKIDRLPLLFAVLRTTRLHIAPAVFHEVTQSLTLRRPYADAVLALVTTGQIEVLALTDREAMVRDSLPTTLGTGERESIAIAEGGGIRKTSRLVGVSRGTVARYAVLAGQQARSVHEELVAFSPADARGAVRREVGLRGQERKTLRP